MENSYEKLKKNLYGVIILGIIFFIFISFWYVNNYSKSIVSHQTFTVKGEGEVIVIPNIAEVAIGVLSEGDKNLNELQKENSEKMNKVIEFLKEKGVEEKDIQTIIYDISPRYQYFDCSKMKICPPPQIVGYSINQKISVKIRDFKKIGEILKGVVEKGANDISSFNFTLDEKDLEKYQNQAREKAIKKAKEKAFMIAQEAGFKLGKLISFQEEFSPYFPVPLKEYGGGEEIPPSISPLIEAGVQKIKVVVSLTYEIK